MAPRLIHIALTVATALPLAACQSAAVSPIAEQADPIASAPPIRRGLDAVGLATLLTAEIAGQRGDYASATRGYLETGERYRSVALIERAALAARFSGDQALLETTAMRWYDLAPQAEAPTRLLSSLALQRGDWLASLDYRLALAERGEHGELASFSELAIEEGGPLPVLLERLTQYLVETDAAHPQRHDAVLATALIEAAIGNVTQAQARLARLGESHAELPELWLAQARIALDADDPTSARQAARRGREVAPEDGRFILMLAQSELLLGNISAAENQTDALIERHVGGHELRLILAQLYLEEGHTAPARRLLLPLVSEVDTPAMAYTLLGAIAEQEGQVDNALLYYRQVPAGDQFLQARLLAARMLINDDRLEDARSFLHTERLRHDEQAASLAALEAELLDQQGLGDEADELLERELRRSPGAEELLYLRAMRAFSMGDLAAMEEDLQRLIERQPDHAMALNALGYTLVDMTDRHQEGMELIERAYRLEPANPAILDSMGWGYYKLGNNQRALEYLERAYAMMPDQEVAAHLAEVLWELGHEAQARALIEQALERYDERPVIDDLLYRTPELAPEPTLQFP
ncbi:MULTISPECIES: tetratricopeptide repeat protein [Halomonadaceae]|uniref:tetratricopeptide repeat protein n=1 Tax=Halomonadaceae TaxID=28256 RepID=UPI00159A5349|nr:MULTISPECIES: tetratricopeptide repeat protein [Halomonas]QJQ96471.1 tetratricopeptide repeat protein [Halomonas sp. PA5]